MAHGGREGAEAESRKWKAEMRKLSLLRGAQRYLYFLPGLALFLFA